MIIGSVAVECISAFWGWMGRNAGQIQIFIALGGIYYVVRQIQIVQQHRSFELKMQVIQMIAKEIEYINKFVSMKLRLEIVLEEDEGGFTEVQRERVQGYLALFKNSEKDLREAADELNLLLEKMDVSDHTPDIATLENTLKDTILSIRNIKSLHESLDDVMYLINK